jgi:hypothetical protein
MRACNYSLRSMMRRRRRFWAEWSAAGINSVTSASLVQGNKGARVRQARNERLELAISLGRLWWLWWQIRCAAVRRSV